MNGLQLLALAALTLLGMGLLEVLLHRRHLKKIPIRIHVSGTRGKSSVTRLLAAGLQHAGIRTVAKTTGTLPRMILPDGREVPVFRPSGANIIEQIRIVSAAHNMKAEALVMECMALIPELHWLSESKLVRATHGVITNARADHLDVMGPTEQDVALTLAGMIPVKGSLFTAERKHLAVLQAAAKDRGSELLAVEQADLDAVTDEELTGFRYLEHRENVALTLKILTSLGIKREVALAGMWQTAPDPGALTEFEVNFFGRKIHFVNAFAANDPQSTLTVWEMAQSRFPDVNSTIAVFNLRADRPVRSLQLARDTTFWRQADKIVLMGTGAYLFARVASRVGVDPGRFVHAEGQGVEQVFETLVGLCGRSTLIVGMANIGGQGLGLVQLFRNRSTLSPEGV